jgi:hypothetical protein
MAIVSEKYQNYHNVDVGNQLTDVVRDAVGMTVDLLRSTRVLGMHHSLIAGGYKEMSSILADQ